MIQAESRSENCRPFFVDIEEPLTYLPHQRVPDIIALGMQRNPELWIEPVADVEVWASEKQRLRDAVGDRVYRALPEAVPAIKELADVFVARKVMTNAALDRLANFRDEEWLWALSLQVAEDLVIMLPGEEGFTLSAASLCRPSHWRLPEKIGKPIRRVHDPIPTIHDKLSPQIDRFFERLRGDIPVERFNWSVQAGAEHFTPDALHQPVAPDTPLYYRTERQTLLHLPETGAVVFTIRVYVHPLAMLHGFDGAMDALFAAIEAAPPSVAEYKSFPLYAAALEKYRQTDAR